MSSSRSSSGGIGFFGALTIAFIVLKLTNFISWEWWVVLLPTTIPIAILFIVLVVYLAMLLFFNK